MSAFGRSGMGGQVSQEIVEAIRMVMREMQGFTGNMREASRATEENTRKGRDLGSFVANYAAKASRDIGRETAFGIASDIARYAPSTQQEVLDTVKVNALEAVRARGIPGLSDLATEVLQPLEAAGNRTLGVTGEIARAGGKVRPEDREALHARFLAEEKRATAEALEVGKLKGANLGDAVDGTKIGDILKMLEDAIAKIVAMVTGLPGAR